eukprot:CAMPEP_0194033826 /NCGR_PEP_ID=MMETSP0009_2-20130614/6347_1 /TAXON_ID=210454 /ORGANISM="Grammatophora oceanica, Strain CCMP 410" /LENGTH=619 /DNA_ID=CAMNT_0038674553 /DNA_START=97 /DNA_END=1956 /DNA_ORIENTATION=-
MSSAADRNAEIWSTRLQKELLALTTATKESPLLPPFINLEKHELDIGQGTCKVSFVIDVPNPKETTPTAAAEPTTPSTSEGGETPQSPSATEGASAASSDAAPAATAAEAPRIVVALNVSLARKPSDGSLDATAPAYPFIPPSSTLASGATLFPSGSTIKNGDPIAIDCDWTPSLHLTDAILNVGLQVKESILQGEPLHAALGNNTGDSIEDTVDDLVKGAKNFGNFLGSSARGMASSLSELGASAAATKPKKPMTMPKVPKFTMPKRQPKQPRAKATAKEININDEINLLESPWVDCRGLYSCKAIRRPGFIEDAMTIANQKAGGQVAGAGFAGLGSTFRSFAASAKSVMEESFVMITDTHIIELRSSKLNLSQGTVTFAISIDLMAKLKFRREESISLFFKPAPNDPLIMMCPDSADAVQQIQHVLKRKGVKGKHTNATTQKAIHEALQLVQEIQAKERALEYQPSVERVNEIMDLYRQAAERFEVAGDIRHEEVVVHMRKFLAQPLAASILDGSYKPDPSKVTPKNPDGGIPEGEILERTKEQLEDVDGPTTADLKKSDKDFEQNIDALMDEAKKMTNMEGDLDDLLKEDADNAGMDDLDAMLKTADKELADLMAS